MESGEKRIAVLIDADNVSSDYIRFIFDEVSNHGAPTIKRIYGDFTHPRLGKWKTVLLDYSIIPIQQYSYTYGKNSTDSALIIDAMDILYSRSIDGFCIVSSDSDFTRLASRLRESGMTVIGMGERKTPTPFVNACEQFKYLEVLAESNKGDESAEDEAAHKSSATPSRPSLSKAITAIIDDVADADGWASLGSVGQRLNTRYPAFDSRNYGFKKLSHLVDSFKKFEVQSRITPNQQEAQTFIRYTEVKPGKNKPADGEGKAGKKSKKFGKEGFDADKKKNGSKKKKSQYREDFAPHENIEAIVREPALVPSAAAVSPDLPLQAPETEPAVSQSGPGFMNVAAAIAKFTSPRREESASAGTEAPEPAEPASALPETPGAADKPESLPPSLPDMALSTESRDEPTALTAAAAETETQVLPSTPADEAKAAPEIPDATDALPAPEAEPENAGSMLVDLIPTAETEPATGESGHSSVLIDLIPSKEDAAEEAPQQAPPKTRSRTKKAAAEKTEPEKQLPESTDADMISEESAAETEGAAKPKRARRTTKQTAETESGTEVEAKPKRRTRAAAKPAAEPAAADAPESGSETAASPAGSAEAAEEPKKRTRRTTKAAVAPADEEPVAEPKKRTRRTTKAAAEDGAETAETETPKKRTRRTAKAAGAAEESAQTSDVTAADTVEAEAPKKRTRRTAKKTEEGEPAEETPKKRARRTAKSAADTEEETAPKKRTRRSAKAEALEDEAPAASAETAASAAASAEPDEPTKPARKRRAAGTAKKKDAAEAAAETDRSEKLEEPV